MRDAPNDWRSPSPRWDDGARGATGFEAPDDHHVEQSRGAEPLRAGWTAFEQQQRAQNAAGQPSWAPFKDREEWEFAEWAMKSGLSQGELDKLLKLDAVCTPHFGLHLDI
jgi:hypothetical protein